MRKSLKTGYFRKLVCSMLCLLSMSSVAVAADAERHGADARPMVFRVATGGNADTFAANHPCCLRREAVKTDNDSGIAWINVFGRECSVPIFDFETMNTVTGFEEKASTAITWMDFTALPYARQDPPVLVYGYRLYADYVSRPGFVRFRAVTPHAAADGAFPLESGESAALLLPDENGTWRVFYFALEQ